LIKAQFLVNLREWLLLATLFRSRHHTGAWSGQPRQLPASFVGEFSSKPVPAPLGPPPGPFPRRRGQSPQWLRWRCPHGSSVRRLVAPQPGPPPLRCVRPPVASGGGLNRSFLFFFFSFLRIAWPPPPQTSTPRPMRQSCGGSSSSRLLPRRAPAPAGGRPKR